MLCGGLSAATVTVPAVADTSIFEGNKDFNLGGTTLVSGTNQQYARSKAMFRFDLGSIPEGALVTGAEVALYVSRQPDPDQHGGAANSDFSLYRLLVSWGEGTGSLATGSGAALGDATWNDRHYGSTPWASAGALIGQDYAETASATTFVSNVGSYLWPSSPTMAGDVQGWLDAPETNFGFILVNQNETALGTGRRFGSTGEPGGLVPPPLLTVSYTLVPEPSVAGLFLLMVAGLTMIRMRRI